MAKQSLSYIYILEVGGECNDESRQLEIMTLVCPTSLSSPNLVFQHRLPSVWLLKNLQVPSFSF